MIELNEKTQQDFLNRKWVQKLLDAGVDMSDAKYWIGLFREGETITEKIFYKKEVSFKDSLEYEIKTGYKLDMYPTYTVSELLYKLHEYIYPTIDGKKYAGGLTMIKDAPFYICYYDLKDKFTEEGKSNQNYLCASFEYPIESLAGLLIQCHKKDIGIEKKDTGDISNK